MENKVWFTVVRKQDTNEASVTHGGCRQKWSEIFDKQKSFISKYVFCRSINFYRDHSQESLYIQNISVRIGVRNISLTNTAGMTHGIREYI